MEKLTHECGIALCRLLKPLSYYEEKYGTWQWGLNLLNLMMQKQLNRGTDGHGVCVVSTDNPAGKEYIFRERHEGEQGITHIFNTIHNQIDEAIAESICHDDLPWRGQMMFGHLRYSTTGKKGVEYLHPFVRRHTYRAKSVVLCGNFNLANQQEVFDSITKNGQYPTNQADTNILLEMIAHRLDIEYDKLSTQLKQQGLSGLSLALAIEERLQLSEVFQQVIPQFDGGFALCCTNGCGEMICCRDPWGIRPAYWYQNDEVVLVASERSVIQTAMNLDTHQVHELGRGEAITISRHGEVALKQIVPPKQEAQCSFERIYFSRMNDADIYNERKQLGINLAEQVYQAVEGDLNHTVISYIPNTAEVAAHGLVEGLNNIFNKLKAKEISNRITQGACSEEEIHAILSQQIRSEKVVVKDSKLRKLFLSDSHMPYELRSHVYDTVYDIVHQEVDNLVVIDDSVIRGTTLKDSIINILNRLRPKRIIFVSSAPMVKYCDFYGIDMQHIEHFIAFRAAIDLLQERGLSHIIDDTYTRCLSTLSLPKEACTENYVKAIYASFSDQELSRKIAELVRSEDTVPVTCLFQTLDGLHQACPNHTGDWYFSGNYPTCGGYKNINKAFVHFYQEWKK